MSGVAAVFLDRDGVLNEPEVRDGKSFAPLRLEAFHIVTEAPEGVRRLRRAGLLCIVVTNQPEIARGALDPDTLAAMHHRLREATEVDDILICPHDSDTGCGCHKPEPGLLHQAARKWSVELNRSYLVGDRWRDIDAGRAVGAFTILIQRPYSRCDRADAVVDTLTTAVDLILRRVENG